MRIDSEAVRSADASILEREPQRQLALRRARLLRYLVRLHSALNDACFDLADSLCARFSDTLVDYLFLGHFQVYPRLAAASAQRPLLCAIASTTEEAMSFQDRFGRAELALPTAQARTERAARHAALESLALALETRFELEDDLLVSADT